MQMCLEETNPKYTFTGIITPKITFSTAHHGRIIFYGDLIIKSKADFTAFQSLKKKSLPRSCWFPTDRQSYCTHRFFATTIFTLEASNAKSRHNLNFCHFFEKSLVFRC
jgi:hypothetical protein